MIRRIRFQRPPNQLKSRVRWPFLCLLAIVAVWGGTSLWRRANRETFVLATTSCPFRGEPRIVLSPDLPTYDTLPVRVHEEVHAGQCRQLGPWRYRLRNLSSSGKLAMEAPAYCAASDARFKLGLDSGLVAERLIDDATEALSNIADSGSVDAALRKNCASIVELALRHAAERAARSRARR